MTSASEEGGQIKLLRSEVERLRDLLSMAGKTAEIAIVEERKARTELAAADASLQQMTKALEEALESFYEVANQAGDPWDGNAPPENLLKKNLELLKTIEKWACGSADKIRAALSTQGSDT
jgi:outer membrane protein TolC